MRKAQSAQKIYLQDELPRIGAGWRWVKVKWGRKHVRVACVASGRCQWINRALAEKLFGVAR